MELGFRIPWAESRIPPDKILGFRILQAKISGISLHRANGWSFKKNPIKKLTNTANDIAFFEEVKNQIHFWLQLYWGLSPSPQKMHLFTSPWGRSHGYPGEYVGDNKGMDWFLCPLREKNRQHCFHFKGKEWRRISGFLIEKHSNKGTLSRLVKFPHPWGKLILRPVYNPPWLARGPTSKGSHWYLHYTQYVHLFTNMRKMLE